MKILCLATNNTFIFVTDMCKTICNLFIRKRLKISFPVPSKIVYVVFQHNLKDMPLLVTGGGGGGGKIITPQNMQKKPNNLI
jgi:FlaA1/EpsC-like NDP-sugar epimerase